MFKSPARKENIQYLFLDDKIKKGKPSKVEFTDAKISQIIQQTFAPAHRVRVIKSTGERDALYFNANVIEPPIFKDARQEMHLTIDHWFESRPKLQTDLGQTHITIVSEHGDERIELRFYCNIYGEIKDIVAKQIIAENTSHFSLTSEQKTQAYLHTAPFTAFLTALLQYKAQVYLDLANQAQQLDLELSTQCEINKIGADAVVLRYIRIAETMHRYQPERQTRALIDRLEEQRAFINASPESVALLSPPENSPATLVKKMPEVPCLTLKQSPQRKQKKVKKPSENQTILTLQQDVLSEIEEFRIHLATPHTPNERLTHETTSFKHAQRLQQLMRILELLDLESTHSSKSASIQSFITEQRRKIPERFNTQLVVLFKQAVLSGHLETIEALYPVIEYQIHQDIEQLFLDFMLKFIKCKPVDEAHFGDVCEFLLIQSPCFKMAFIRYLSIYTTNVGLDCSPLFKMLLMQNYRAFSLAIQYARLDFPVLVYQDKHFSPLHIAIYFYNEEQQDQRFIEALLEQKVPLEFHVNTVTCHFSAIDPGRSYKNESKSFASKYAKATIVRNGLIPPPTTSEQITQLQEALLNIAEIKNALELTIYTKKISLLKQLCATLSEKELLNFSRDLFCYSVFIDQLCPFSARPIQEEEETLIYKDILDFESNIQTSPHPINYTQLRFYLSETVGLDDQKDYLKIGHIVYQELLTAYTHIPDEELRQRMQALFISGCRNTDTSDLFLSHLHYTLLREKTLEDHRLFFECYYHRAQHTQAFLALYGLLFLISLPKAIQTQMMQEPLYTQVVDHLMTTSFDNPDKRACVQHLIDSLEEKPEEQLTSGLCA